MYFASVLLFMFVLPVTCILVQGAHQPFLATLPSLTLKWFVFWAVGVRLFIAGIRQIVQPSFTAEEILGIRDQAAHFVIRELGFANLSIGFVGLCSLAQPTWSVPAAIVGGLYYGFAGAAHVFHPGKNAKELTAMISDVFVFIVLLVAVLLRFHTAVTG